MMHNFWSCPKLEKFWVLEREIELPSAFFLLHYNQLSKKCYKSSLAHNLVTAACACIPTLWKKLEPPSIKQWVFRVNNIELREDLRSSLKGIEFIYEAKWHPWNEVLSQGDLEVTPCV